MAFDENAAERVRRALGQRRGITEKKMMGALCFMASGTMCCGITGAALMVRVGTGGFARVLARPHVRPLKIGRHAARGFVLIDPPIIAARQPSRGGSSTASPPRKRSAQRQTVAPPRAPVKFCSNVECWGQIGTRRSFNSFACEHRRKGCGSFVHALRFADAEPSV